MREIKFRVWDKKEKQMNWTDKPQLNQGRAVKFNFMMPWRRNIFSNEWELMQFTGLHDKNGKEVYEGDICRNIVKYPAQHKMKYHDVVGEVNFKDGGFFVGDNFVLTQGRSQEIEVIGNVFENPELLKGSK